MDKKEPTSVRLSRKVYDKLSAYKDNLDINTYSDAINHLLCEVVSLTEIMGILKENQKLLKHSVGLIEEQECAVCDNNKKNKKN